MAGIVIPPSQPVQEAVTVLAVPKKIVWSEQQIDRLSQVRYQCTSFETILPGHWLQKRGWEDS